MYVVSRFYCEATFFIKMPGQAILTNSAKFCPVAKKRLAAVWQTEHPDVNRQM
jgi:hypothetical protein